MSNRLGELNVLAVDDHGRALQLLKTILRELGVNQVFTAKDGREAQNFPDQADEMVNLIICDWNMPRMTGLELLQQVRTVYSDMPFMMVTGRGDADSVKAAASYGVDAYIRKPYSTKQIATKLEAISKNLKAHEKPV
jgi:two-component system chemotaxis response regulator CheY